MKIICNRHNRKYGVHSLYPNDEGIFCCHYCLLEHFWQANNWEYVYCPIHKMSELLRYGGCIKCKYPEQSKEEIEEQLKLDAVQAEESRNRVRLYYESKSECVKHRNEKCSSCDKPIDFDEWFCYCSLCPDCYLNSDEEIDNYLGEKPKPT